MGEEFKIHLRLLLCLTDPFLTDFCLIMFNVNETCDRRKGCSAQLEMNTQVSLGSFVKVGTRSRILVNEECSPTTRDMAQEFVGL